MPKRRAEATAPAEDTSVAGRRRRVPTVVFSPPVHAPRPRGAKAVSRAKGPSDEARCQLATQGVSRASTAPLTLNCSSRRWRERWSPRSRE